MSSDNKSDRDFLFKPNTTIESKTKTNINIFITTCQVCTYEGHTKRDRRYIC